MKDEEPITVKTSTVDCEGGGGALGHPKVYLFVKPGMGTVCPYCSCRFVLDERAPQTAGH